MLSEIFHPARVHLFRAAPAAFDRRVDCCHRGTGRVSFNFAAAQPGQWEDKPSRATFLTFWIASGLSLRSISTPWRAHSPSSGSVGSFKNPDGLMLHNRSKLNALNDQSCHQFRSVVSRRKAASCTLIGQATPPHDTACN